MDDQQRRAALEDAVRNAVATHATGTAPPRKRASGHPPTWRVAVILSGWAFIGWIWLAEPAMVFGPRATPDVPAAEREARLRYAMYIHQQEISAFRRDHGRPPHSLGELPKDQAHGVRLEFDQDGAWALVGRDGDLTLRLTERMSADSFLGTSLATLRDAP